MQKTLRSIGWLILIVLFISYSILAMEHSFYLFTDAPQLWHQLLSKVSSEEYAKGAGSVFQMQTPAYLANKGAMIIHTFFGGLTLALGLVQLSSRLRKRWPMIHRRIGYGYLTAAIISLTGSSLFLLRIDSTEAFSGSSFYWGLSGLCISSWESLFFLVWSARKRYFGMHKQFAILNYCLIATAPVLRMGWIAGSGIANQNIVNLSISMFLVPLCLIPSLFLTKDTSRSGELEVVSHSTIIAGTLVFITTIICCQVWPLYHMTIIGSAVATTALILCVRFLPRILAYSTIIHSAFMLAILTLLVGEISFQSGDPLDTESIIKMSCGIPWSLYCGFSIIQLLLKLSRRQLSLKWLTLTIAFSYSPIGAYGFYLALKGTYDDITAQSISLMMAFALATYLAHRAVMVIEHHRILEKGLHQMYGKLSRFLNRFHTSRSTYIE